MLINTKSTLIIPQCRVLALQTNGRGAGDDSNKGMQVHLHQQQAHAPIARANEAHVHVLTARCKWGYTAHPLLPRPGSRWLLLGLPVFHSICLANLICKNWRNPGSLNYYNWLLIQFVQQPWRMPFLVVPALSETNRYKDPFEMAHTLLLF